MESATFELNRWLHDRLLIRLDVPVNAIIELVISTTRLTIRRIQTKRWITKAILVSAATTPNLEYCNLVMRGRSWRLCFSESRYYFQSMMAKVKKYLIGFVNSEKFVSRVKAKVAGYFVFLYLFHVSWLFIVKWTPSIALTRGIFFFEFSRYSNTSWCDFKPAMQIEQ